MCSRYTLMIYPISTFKTVKHSPCEYVQMQYVSSSLYFLNPYKELYKIDKYGKTNKLSFHQNVHINPFLPFILELQSYLSNVIEIGSSNTSYRPVLTLEI